MEGESQGQLGGHAQEMREGFGTRIASAMVGERQCPTICTL